MKHIIKKEDAVSPVVGVMLMLVVTIVIAAVVSAFAGGVAGDQNKVPQASVVATEFVINGIIDSNHNNMYGQGLARPDQGATNASADIYVIFKHNGGDSLNLDKVEVHLSKLSEPQVGSLVSRSLTPQTGPDLTTSQGNFGTVGDKTLLSGFSKSWIKYLEKYPERSSVVITAGDKFILHADYGATDSNGRNEVAWLQQAGSYSFPIRQGDVLTYDLIDSNSKKTISSGQINVPEFTVG
jgi:hypothetical protein